MVVLNLVRSSPFDGGLIMFGIITYGLAWLSWPLEAALIWAPFWVWLIVPVIPWLLCFAYVIFETRKFRLYWWILPSAVLALHWWLVGGLMMLAWSIGGFV